MLSPAMATLCRRNLAAFTLATNPGYQMGWFHKDVAARLMRFLANVKAKKSPRLMLFAPPRHGKSQLTSKSFSSWALGCEPDFNIISATYGDDLAKRINKDVQRMMDNEIYGQIFPDVKLSAKRNAGGYNNSAMRTMDLFEIPGHRGSFRTTGVGGGITGMGAEIIIIDDPLKDRKCADSPTMRQAVWDWYTSTAYTRLAPGGGMIVMLTRWHDDDLAGRLKKAMNDGGDQWEIIEYPAIAEHDEKFRKKGEALHPDRYPLDALERIKRAIGSYDWEALYQQHPTPRAGGLFKRDWVRYYDNVPKVFDRVIQSWDLTFKDSSTGDYVAGFVLGQIGADIYVLDCVHQQIDFVGQIKAIMRTTAKWPQATAKVIEDKANGPAIISALKGKVPGIVPFNPHGGKEQRANSAAPIVESGNLILPRTAPWLNEFETEFFNFPGAPHDDMVDALDQGILYLTQGQQGGILSWI